jgi:hypothetical protein
MESILANLDPTLIGVAGTAMTALSGAIVHLYKSQFALQKDLTGRVQNQLDECLEDRRALQSEQKQLWTALIKLDPSAEELRTIK